MQNLLGQELNKGFKTSNTEKRINVKNKQKEKANGKRKVRPKLFPLFFYII
jgi:hypothetical protein